MRILIADDEPISRRRLSSILKKWKYEVVEASNGDEAWAQLEGGGDWLAILDWLMPGLNGPDLCRKMRQQASTTVAYLILLTGKTHQDDIVEGLDAGADDYLSKPFAPEELRARIEVGMRVLNLQRTLADRVVELNEALAERTRAEESLKLSEKRYRHLVDNSLGLICTHDLEGTLLSINPAAARLLEYQPAEMIGKKLSDFIIASHRAQFSEYLARVRSNRTTSGLFHAVTRSGKELIWQYHNAKYVEDAKTQYVLGHAQDVTKLKRAEAAMRNLSLRDELTGLYNRRGFFALAEQHLKTLRRPGKTCSLICADVDGLKQINDTYGHEEGSKAIAKIAEILKKTFRASDIIARMGGDEFMILAVDVPFFDHGISLVRLRENLRAYNAARSHNYLLSISIGGICVDGENRYSIDQLMAKADLEMYKDKKNKKAPTASEQSIEGLSLFSREMRI